MNYLTIGHSMLFVLRICVQRCLSLDWHLILFVLVCNSVEAVQYSINCSRICLIQSQSCCFCVLWRSYLLRHLNLFVGLKHLFTVQLKSRIIIILISSAPSSFCPSTSSPFSFRHLHRGHQHHHHFDHTQFNMLHHSISFHTMMGFSDSHKRISHLMIMRE